MAKGDATSLNPRLNFGLPRLGGVIGARLNPGLNPNAGFGSMPLQPSNPAINAALGNDGGMLRSFIGPSLPPTNNIPTVNMPAVVPQPNVMKSPTPVPSNSGPSEDLMKKLMGHNYSYNV